MAFPSTIDSFTTKNNGDTIAAADVNGAQTAIAALETKIGVDGSAVTASLDYLLKNTASADPGHKHTEASITLADVTTIDVSTSKHGLVPKAPNDSTKFLRGDATWAVPASAATPQYIFTTCFETTGRFVSLTSGGGANTFSTYGLQVDTSAGAGGKAGVTIRSNNSATFDGNSNFSTRIIQINFASNFQFYFGVSNDAAAFTGTTLTLTQKQYGFKILCVAGVATVYATCANGSTETATALSGVAYDATATWVAIKNGTTSILYYVNGVLKATHTTNIPAGNSANAALGQVMINNSNAAEQATYQIANFTFCKDAY